MERLVDTAAREMGIDPIQLRRRNLVPNSAFPYTAASGQVIDSGDFEAMLVQAVAASDWAGFAGARPAPKHAA